MEMPRSFVCCDIHKWHPGHAKLGHDRNLWAQRLFANSVASRRAASLASTDVSQHSCHPAKSAQIMNSLFLTRNLSSQRAVLAVLNEKSSNIFNKFSKHRLKNLAVAPAAGHMSRSHSGVFRR